MKKLYLLLCLALLFVIKIPASAETFIDGYYTYTISDGKATITDFDSEEYDKLNDYRLSIPSVLNNFTVVAIADYAFSGCDSSVYYIPDTVESIGMSAFKATNATKINVGSLNPVYSSIGGVLYNKNATELIYYPEERTGSYTIPEGVTAVGGQSFYGHTNITGITMPDSLVSIGNRAFGSCGNLANIGFSGSSLVIDDEAFRDCTAITSVDLSGVTDIGNSVFSGCTALTKISIPETVSHMGKYIFNNCPSLKTINIDSENLYYYSKDNVIFDDINKTLLFCINTKSGVYTVPDGILSIGGCAFADCTAITEIKLPDSIMSIGDSAFSECGNLVSINIPEGVTVIDSYTFYGCGKLENVSLPPSLRNIGISAFYGCRISSVVIPYGVTKISDYAFADCNRLSSVTIPSTVKLIGSDAFSGCLSVADVYYGGIDWQNVTVYNGNDCLATATLHYPPTYTSDIFSYRTDFCGNAVITVCNKNASGIINVPSDIDGYNIIGVGSNAFTNCNKIIGIILSDGIITIDGYAFSDCGRLVSITIPQSVSRIEVGAFFLCDQLTDVFYRGAPGQWNTIETDSENNYCLEWANLFFVNEQHVVVTEEDYSFIVENDNARIVSCSTSVTGDVTIPDIMDGYPVVTIGNSAFNECTEITSVELSEAIMRIDNYAFYGCSNITEITMPESVTSVGENAFGNCTALADVYYSGTYEQWCSIGMGPGNEYLQNATIHTAQNPIEPDEPVESNFTFEITDAGAILTKCSPKIALGSIVIPDAYEGYKVVGIGADAFSDCSMITEITVPDTVEYIGAYAFSYCTRLEKITVPNSVESIGGGAFNMCESLVQFSIPDKITTISGAMFDCCASLQKVIIPKGITDIQWYAFNNCSSLKNIYYRGSAQEWSNISIDYAFNEPLKDAEFYFDYASETASVKIIQYSKTNDGYKVKTQITNLTSYDLPVSYACICVYNSKGAFKVICGQQIPVKDAAAELEAVINCETEPGDIIKLMLWDEKMTPLALPYTLPTSLK